MLILKKYHISKISVFVVAILSALTIFPCTSIGKAQDSEKKVVFINFMFPEKGCEGECTLDINEEVLERQCVQNVNPKAPYKNIKNGGRQRIDITLLPTRKCKDKGRHRGTAWEYKINYGLAYYRGDLYCYDAPGYNPFECNGHSFFSKVVTKENADSSWDINLMSSDKLMKMKKSRNY